ncbi:phenoloxidase-activating factor 2-like [Drosophila pseudoobscura]|uniref:Phenoloxidase-activating factor 2 n=1 Tax=Drosophila pseudoobscura pseudoobscura TaxID=46245 RepID=A0A6I8UYA9_DROPS|nr:phenoloxidase-activating factor 2 [Drosophila pseudoobscura]
MSKQWALGAILLSCALLGRGDPVTPCGDQQMCVSKDRCLAQMGQYRSAVCQASEVCCDISQVDESVDVTEGPSDAEDLCGMSNPSGLEANANASEDQAKFGEFPWTIALFHKGQYFGGGSLVSQNAVLMAAHLLADKSEADIVVRAGDWDLSSTEESNPHEERQVSRVVKHENFDVKTGSNNLALLFFESPLPRTAHIRPICLATAEKSIEARCFVAGWGKKAYPDVDYSSILKKIELPIVDRDTCQNQLRQTRLGRSFVLAPSFVCAGGENGKDACQGDGGSALFCPLAENTSRYEQVGIVNWGIECGKENVPATYTNVAQFQPWIEQQLNSKP